MRCTITHRRLKPSANTGFGIKVGMLYQSWDEAEVDKLEKELEEKYGSGFALVIDLDVDSFTDSTVLEDDGEEEVWE